jgi:hypothetical protein
MIPEIADYEVRRELLRRGSARSISALDRLEAASAGYITITTQMMRQAAVLWAQARRAGMPMAPDPALDGDVILAAQAIELATQEGDQVVIPTTNPGHLSRYAQAEEWRKIQPPTP